MTPVSFDVVSLYTNINTEEAVETVLEYTIKHHIELHGLETYDLFELLHLLLDNNIFTYNNTHYKQIRGLAMGNRLSGTLAILCMDRFERLHIYQQLHPQLTIYVRYIDDVGTVKTDTEQANTILTYLNEQHPTIKFEMELPDNNGYSNTWHKPEHWSRRQHSPQTLHKTGLEGHHAELPLAPPKLCKKSGGCQRIQAAPQRNTELKPFRPHEQN